jgi:hypothetical protein
MNWVRFTDKLHSDETVKLYFSLPLLGLIEPIFLPSLLYLSVCVIIAPNKAGIMYFIVAR